MAIEDTGFPSKLVAWSQEFGVTMFLGPILVIKKIFKLKKKKKRHPKGHWL